VKLPQYVLSTTLGVQRMPRSKPYGQRSSRWLKSCDGFSPEQSRTKCRGGVSSTRRVFIELRASLSEGKNGGRTVEDTAYDYEHLLAPPPKDRTAIKGLLMAIIIISAVIGGFYVYKMMTPSNIVKFDSVEHIEVLNYPIGVMGSIINNCDKEIQISNITLRIDGQVIETPKTYSLEEVMVSNYSETILPDQTVDFAISLPDLHDRLLTHAGDKLTYWIKVYYDGYENDIEKFDVSDSYN